MMNYFPSHHTMRKKLTNYKTQALNALNGSLENVTINTDVNVTALQDTYFAF